MNILFTYIRKYLQKNKLSTLLSILSLITASALFYIVVCLGTNCIIGLNETIINSFGNYHAIYKDVEEHFIESLNLHGQISTVNTVEYKKQIYVDCFQSEEKDSFYLLGMDYSTFDDLGLSLIEGRYPTNTEEILITNDTLDDSKIRLDIGRILELDNEEYKIVGIISNPYFEYNQAYHTILSIKDNTGIDYAYVRYKNRSDSYVITNQITQDFIGQYESYEINENYFYNPLTQSNRFIFIFSIFVCILVITFFAMNIFLIRNCYKNSYSNREKHLAILKTVGVTQSQCMTMILYEGIFLLVISLIIGSITGWILYEILRNVLNQLLISVSVQSFIIGNEHCTTILLITIVYVVCAALFFIRRSSKKIIARSVSSTLQSNDEVEIMDHPYLELEKKQSIFMRLLKKNIRQNRQSYRHLFIGVTGIATIFILVNGFMGYLREGIFFETNDHNYDVEVVVQNEFYPTKLMTQLKNREYASSVVISEKLYLECKDFSILDENYEDVNLLNETIQFEIITYSDHIIEDFVSFTDYEQLSDRNNPTGILINQTYSFAHRRFYDILTVNMIDELLFQDKVVLSNIQLIETDSLLTGASYQKNPQIIVTHDLFNQISKEIEFTEHEYHIYFQSNDSTSLVRELNLLNDGSVIDFDIINTQASIRNGKVVITLIRIISYGYILLLGLMSILSISCVASVNFDYRRREFMLYRVLGLRMADMMKLIFAELCYYVFKVFTYAWMISQLLNYIFYELYFKDLGLHFFIPENSIIGSITIVIMVLVVSMSYIYLRMKSLKYSIILKNEISMM